MSAACFYIPNKNPVLIKGGVFISAEFFILHHLVSGVSVQKTEDRRQMKSCKIKRSTCPLFADPTPETCIVEREYELTQPVFYKLPTGNETRFYQG
jgi:hypothetical protein